MRKYKRQKSKPTFVFEFFWYATDLNTAWDYHTVIRYGYTSKIFYCSGNGYRNGYSSLRYEIRCYQDFASTMKDSLYRANSFGSIIIYHFFVFSCNEMNFFSASIPFNNNSEVFIKSRRYVKG